MLTKEGGEKPPFNETKLYLIGKPKFEVKNDWSYFDFETWQKQPRYTISDILEYWVGNSKSVRDTLLSEILCPGSLAICPACWGLHAGFCLCFKQLLVIRSFLSSRICAFIWPIFSPRGEMIYIN